MLKEFVALVRGRSYDQAETVIDRNATIILRQQIRDCAGAVEGAQRALAAATVHHQQEIRQNTRILASIADLEARGAAALRKGEEDLAREAAEAIAGLESEKAAGEAAQQRYEREIGRLRGRLRQSETRLRELRRGQRLAEAAERAQRLHDAGAGSTRSTLRDAERTLDRLRQRQNEAEATAAALDDLAREQDPETISEKLAAAGCGSPLGPSAEAVLDRLRRKIDAEDQPGRASNA
ncbi:PspA/IM30 family protein [Consotaella salsifontis]|uniref:Phage shock protein A (PspA) family protein n=1 Tax=Consotaella salsifontis TaxID=1365950 RepID=A0A1T4SHG6_9HYPH|nr:PspA/IM30 family protein [Consotaella salsifontis]SKA27744.1 phage shock protein A (PspA) family protein [Consotaella salsifontis]